ncbi:Histidyl-tRNA synthetase [uncultured virus]|nr:Histidyl-tRNA synthetase [uncultured virus]
MEPLSGTRDFYPEDMRIREWLFTKWKQVSEKFGFSQYDAPILELSSLYTKKGGDDIINEMYCFKDKEKRDVCLRPEMTPSLARMVMKILKEEILPLKWFSIAQCWRFETTTSFRKREHYQWNVDIFGSVLIKSDAEILSLIVTFLKEIGFTENDIIIKISNRQILQNILKKKNIDKENLIKTFNIIDKINKLPKEEIINLFKNQIGLNDDDINFILNLINLKKIDEFEILLDIDDDSMKQMKNIFFLTKSYGIDKWIEFDISIVRGLTYYTGIVFEGFFKSCDIKRSIFGGGRYDNLLETYGYPKSVPAIGFGMGDIVILEGLKLLNKLPRFDENIEFCIISYNDEMFPHAINITNRLRDHNKKVNLYMKTDKKIKLAFSYADRIGANKVIFVAPNEIKDNKMVLKDLRNTEDKELIVEIDNFFNNLV